MASRNILDRLGISGDATLGELASIPWSGRAERDADEPLDAILARGEADPSGFEPIGWPEDLSPGLSFARSRSKPSLVRVEGPQVCSAAVVGTARRVGADALVFVATEGSALRVGARLLSVEDSKLALDALASDEVEAQELSPFSARALANLVVVERWKSPLEAELLAVFDGIDVAEWLVADAGELAERGGAHSFAAALGLIGRLHTERSEAPSALVAALIDGRAQLASPRAKIDAWWRKGASVDEVARSARLEVERAREALDALSRAADEAHPALASIARRWIRQRDDLECARFALSIARAEPSIAAQLDALDRAAEAQLTLFSAVGGFADSTRLVEVSWQEPHLWWGALAV
ncbi:MAG: hypothetical protein JNK05_34040 [Myxococcales bacterium]|nr:hypothetical protein [Myxococcales bacterium]